MKNSVLVLLGIFLSIAIVRAQTVTVEGYVFEDGNRGYLNQVSINVYDAETKTFVGGTQSNIDGFFTLELNANEQFVLEATKDIFEKKEVEFQTTEEGKVFLKVPMIREDGYLFEVTLAPKREDENEVVDAITGALIEVYNNTTEEEVLVLENHPSPDFEVQFKKGNHYTVLVRKEGYLGKRMEAFVNVEGCILCFEGVGQVRPGVADNLTEGMRMGTLLANVEMIPIHEGKVIELENVYYDFGKATLTEQAKETLRNLARIMKDNPGLMVELGSHTDVRGTTSDNLDLSQRRAQSAVEFLTNNQGIESDRLIAKGYGESQIKNKCRAGVTCTDEEHAENRRTEVKILELGEDELNRRSLAAMKVEENFLKQVLGEGVEQVSYPIKDAKPDEEMESDPGMEDVESSQQEEEISEGSAGIEVLKSADVSEREETKDEMKDEMREEQVKTEQLSKEELPELKDMGTMERKRLDEGKEVVKTKAVLEGNQSVRKRNRLQEMIEKKENNSSYTGYRVVIHFSNVPISADHKIYSEFETIESYKTAQKNVLYMVGDFETLAEADEFLESEVKEKFPSAYITGFKNGIRINIEE